MYYIIDGNSRMDDIEDVLDYCITPEYFMEDCDSFNEYLDEEGSVEVSGLDLYPSDILQNCDRDAYNEQFSNWADNEVENAKENYRYDLERLVNGESIWICNYQVEVFDEEESEDCDGDDEDLDMIRKMIDEAEAIKRSSEEKDLKAATSFMDAYQQIMG